MKGFKGWLCRRFLPEWARESLVEENKRLQGQLAEARAEIAKLNAYLDGREAGLRSQRRIVINNNAGEG